MHMTSNAKVGKKLGQNLLPLSPLSYELRRQGWIEDRAEVNVDRQTAIVRIVHWPEPYTIYRDGTIYLQPVPAIDIPSPLPIRLITQAEIDQGWLMVPDETWNLANFNSTNYKTNGVYAHTLLPSMEAFAAQLGIKYSGIIRSQICFSRVEGTITILPFMRYR